MNMRAYLSPCFPVLIISLSVSLSHFHDPSHYLALALALSFFPEFLFLFSSLFTLLTCFSLLIYAYSPFFPFFCDFSIIIRLECRLRFLSWRSTRTYCFSLLLSGRSSSGKFSSKII